MVFLSFWACGSWQPADKIFLWLEKILSAGSSVGIDQPTGHAFERAGRRPFCRFFSLETEKILLAKMGQAGKNFRGSKIFDGVNFGANQKRAMPFEPSAEPRERFVRPEGLSKPLKGCYLENSNSLGAK